MLIKDANDHAGPLHVVQQVCLFATLSAALLGLRARPGLL